VNDLRLCGVGLGPRGMQSAAPAEEGAPPEAAAADVAEHVPDEREPVSGTAWCGAK
jgi:hypothetical protein